MKRGRELIAVAAAFEIAVALVFIVDPSLVAFLLFGAVPSAPGIAFGRVVGFALLGLGLSCWPGLKPPCVTNAARGLFAYNALVAIFLIYLGFRHELVGWLLWPVAAVHTLIAVLLLRVLITDTAAE